MVFFAKNLKLSILILLSITLFLHVRAEKVAKDYFVEYFAKSYQLRFELKCNRNENSLRLLSTADPTKIDEALERGLKRMEQAKAEFAKVTLKPQPEKSLESAANELWERTFEKMVVQTLEKLGKIESTSSQYVGGLIGVSLGIIAPDLELPLVIGDAFLDGRTGYFLNKYGEKVSSWFVDEFIREKVIDEDIRSDYLIFVNTNLIDQAKLYLCKGASNDKFSGCDHGKYGKDCASKCSNTCSIGCTISGNCYMYSCSNKSTLSDHCEEPNWGFKCEFSCPTTCSNPGCTGGGFCYGWTKESQYLLANHCQPGYFGSSCGKTCLSKNCSSPGCTGNGNCYLWDKASRTNISEHCKVGFWGSACEHDCLSTKCKIPGCTGNGYCDGWDKTSERTTIAEHCEVGFWDFDCNKVCLSENCSTAACTGNGYCYQWENAQDTSIADHCKVGKWGSICNNECPKNCSTPGCTGNGYCFQWEKVNDVNKDEHCKVEKWGNICMNDCPANCSLPGCTGNGNCIGWNSADLSPASHCKSGNWGATCQNSCPEKCSIRCLVNGLCPSPNGNKIDFLS